MAIPVSTIAGADIQKESSMTINELIEQLQALVAEDEFRGDASVTFGSEMEPVEGGILTRHCGTGLLVLNLAPTRLDCVGGF